jgi:hypothetical protein
VSDFLDLERTLATYGMLIARARESRQLTEYNESVLRDYRDHPATTVDVVRLEKIASESRDGFVHLSATIATQHDEANRLISSIEGILAPHEAKTSKVAK